MLVQCPLVSVVMSVYNDAQYLQEAVDSILGQTFRDFEFIIIDDGCTDASPAILSALMDDRVQLLSNGRNMGQTYSLNRGIDTARGTFIARMDANDISLRPRLERQVQLMESDATLGLVSCWYEGLYNGTSGASTMVHLPTTNDELQQTMFYRNGICHAAAMFQRTLFRDVKGYRAEYQQADDWDLWLRFADRCALANVPEILLQCRILNTGLSVMKRTLQRQSSRRLVQEGLLRRDQGTGSTLSALALARANLFVSLEYLAEQRDEDARSALACTFNYYARIDSDWDHINRSVVERAVEYAGFFPGQHSEVAAGVRFINAFATVLPQNIHDMEARRKDILSLYHIALAFQFHSRDQHSAVLPLLMKAVATRPGWLANRGVLGLIRRSLLRPPVRRGAPSQ